MSGANKEDIQKLFELCRDGGSVSEFKQLLSKAGNESILNATDASGWTPLMMAVFWEQIDLVKEILSNANATLKSMRYKYDLYHVSHSGTTLAEISKGIRSAELADLITGETERLERINNKATFMTGYHETEKTAFEFIYKDAMKGRYPMIGGNGGYFGGGIYFAATPEESTEKALNHGMGFKCLLRMGNILKMNTQDSVKAFRQTYCNGESYKTPTDVMRERLLEDKYDSVWGHQDKNIRNVSDRILQTGDEYVVYSADQAIIETYYKIVEIKNTFNDDVYPLRIPHNDEDYETHKHTWIPLILQDKKLEFSNIIPPTRRAKYFTREPDIFEFPPPADNYTTSFGMQSGDIMDFHSNKEQLYSSRLIGYQTYQYPDFIQKCFYLEYPSYKKWIPYLFGTERILNLKYNEFLIDLYKEYKIVVFLQEHFKQMELFKSQKEILSHYRDVLKKDPNIFIQIQPIQWEKAIPILNTSNYSGRLRRLNEMYMIQSWKKTYIVHPDKIKLVEFKRSMIQHLNEDNNALDAFLMQFV